jgi:hypothetical protein
MTGMKIMSHYKTTRKYTLLAALLIVMTQAYAAPPRPINYQGYLTQPDGTPVDTTVTMAVELWTAATAGTLLYAETHAAVTVSKGRFSIEISTGAPVSGIYDAEQFQQETWLALTINGELLSPRSRLGAVAGSQHAEIAERLSTTCSNGEWLGFRDGMLACYACSNGETSGCYEGDPATQNVGECKSGTNTCVEGAYGACTGQVLPDIEICNSKDDDCNGQVDDGTSLPGCINLYTDTDGDGFGDTALPGCLCDTTPNTASVGGDCDDTDANVNPEQTAYFTVPSSLGTFDYNCNGTIEKSLDLTIASCTYNGSGCDYVPGFKDSAPDCGELGVFSNGCSRNGTICTVTTGIIGTTMSCR